MPAEGKVTMRLWDRTNLPPVRYSGFALPSYNRTRLRRDVLRLCGAPLNLVAPEYAFYAMLFNHARHMTWSDTHLS